jgi:hypothetical protein
MVNTSASNTENQQKPYFYSVKTIEEGIKLLTGAKARERRKGGSYEKGTDIYRVDQRLRDMADKLR